MKRVLAFFVLLTLAGCITRPTVKVVLFDMDRSPEKRLELLDRLAGQTNDPLFRNGVELR